MTHPVLVHHAVDTLRVSIITPSYNQAQFLEETIRSVISQDYAGIEYIVIDGGSTDGSVEIIQKYAPRLANWVSEPDKGQADAINKGFRLAGGDIVTWLNADDVYFTRQAVSTMMSAFVEHPGADVIYGDAANIDESGYIRRIRHLPDFNANLLLRTCFIVQPAVFFRAKVIHQHQLDAALHLGMDYEFWLQLARDFRFLHIPCIIAGDRNHSQRKTVSRLGEALLAEREIQRRNGLRSGFHYFALRFLDKSHAIVRRAQGIPAILSLYRRSDLAFNAHFKPKLSAIFDQLFGKDYQKL